MHKNLDLALGYILADEGYTTNEHESESVGGVSKMGVSLLAYQDYCRRKHLSPPTRHDIELLTPPQARDFYAFMFAPPLRFDDLPTGVDYRVLDAGVNLGITGGIHLLLGVLDQPLASAISDTAIKLVATSCATAAGATLLVEKLSVAWLAKHRQSRGWAKYGRGWTNRCNDATKNALRMIEVG